jgi:hypothetical protein
MKNMIVKFIMIAIVLAGLIGCSSAEPQEEALAELATQVIYATAIPIAIPATETPIPPSPTPEVLAEDLALTWQVTYNEGDLDALLALYAPDATWEYSGMPYLPADDGLSTQLAYELALNNHFTLSECQSNGNIASCRGELTNDWLASAQLEPAIYDIIEFTFLDDKIAVERRVLSSDSKQIVAEVFAGLVPWMRWSHSRDIGTVVTEQGELIVDAAIANELVELIAEWQPITWMTDVADLMGVWVLKSGTNGVYIEVAALQLGEDGEGRVVAEEKRLSDPIDLENMYTGYQIEYWFEGPVLNLKQITPGDPVMTSTFYCNRDGESIGQYLVEVLELDSLRFRPIQDPCLARNQVLRGSAVFRSE